VPEETGRHHVDIGHNGLLTLRELKVACMSVAEEIEALRKRGYTADFSVTRDGQLRCDTCGQIHDPSDVVIDSTARFEGASNPDDQAVVFAIRCAGCGVRGVLVTAYGPTASAEEAAVLKALSP
jgi:hypothetical protein